jgi:alkylhydroperoxidase family enzyme
MRNHHPGAHFLDQPIDDPAIEAMYAEDVADIGFVMNASRLWAYQPAINTGLFQLLAAAAKAGALTHRQRCVLVAATASAMGDSYCSLAWGDRLANAAGPAVAARVLHDDDSGLDPPDAALARWARRVVREPSATTHDDVDRLRHAGFTDATIFAATVYVALRMAFSAVNDALGTHPDAALAAKVPTAVRDAVTFGRPAEVG